MFREYYKFSPEEKLLTINITSSNQHIINFSIIVKNTELFTKVENILYENYPTFKETDNYFLANGGKVNRNKTLEENKIKNHDNLTLNIYE